MVQANKFNDFCVDAVSVIWLAVVNFIIFLGSAFGFYTTVHRSVRLDSFPKYIWHSQSVWTSFYLASVLITQQKTLFRTKQASAKKENNFKTQYFVTNIKARYLNRKGAIVQYSAGTDQPPRPPLLILFVPLSCHPWRETRRRYCPSRLGV